MNCNRKSSTLKRSCHDLFFCCFENGRLIENNMTQLSQASVERGNEEAMERGGAGSCRSECSALS